MLTDRQIGLLRPTEKRRNVSVGDGLYIRIEPSGVKSWIARKGGKSRSLGRYPDVSLRDARSAASDLFADPTLFSEVWQQWFDDHVTPTSKDPRNAANLRALWGPIWGRRVDTLKRAELVALLRRLRERAPARSIKATSQLRAVLNYALALGLIENNPMYGVPMGVTGGRPKKRSRVLSDDEIAALKAMAAEPGPAGAHGRFALFCLATLCRRGEAAAAKRSWLDGEWMQFPPRIMKASRAWDVWLSPFAWEQVPPSNEDRLFDLNPETTEKFLNRRKLGWSLHDLRRTGASRMAGMGVAPHVVSTCLAHALGSQSDQHYLTGSLYRDERREALMAWGEVLGR